MHRRVPIWALASLAILAPVVRAQTWTGVTVNQSWNTAGNWDNNTVPNSPTVDVIFPSQSPFFFGTVNVNSSVQARSISFQNTTNNYIVSSPGGATISSLTGITVSSAVTTTDTISAPLQFTGGVSTTGSLTINNNAAATANPTLILSGATGTQDLGGIVIGGSGFTRISGNLGSLGGGTILAGLTKSGAGRLELTGNNALLTGQNVNGTYSITVSGGTLAINSEAALGRTGDALHMNVNSSTTGGLEFLNGGVTISRPVQMDNATRFVCNGTDVNVIAGQLHGSGPLVKDGTGTLFLSNNSNGYGNGLVINGGTVSVQTEGSLSTGHTVAMAGGTLEVSGSFTSNQDITLNSGGGTMSVLTGVTLMQQAIVQGVGGLTKSGPGLLILSPSFGVTNSYSGGTVIVDGTLQIGNASAVPDSTALTLGGGSTSGTLDLNGRSLQVSAFSTSGSGTANTVTNSLAGTVTLTVNNPSVAQAYGGVLTGPIALVKSGAGTLTLSNGGSNYTGGTTVNAGRLIVSNATGSATGTGPVIVNGGASAGGTLGGNGIVSGAVTINTGAVNGAINPGVSPIGTLAIGGGLTVNGTYVADVSSASGTSSDRIDVTGNLTLGANSLLNLPGTNSYAPVGSSPTYTLISFTGTRLGQFNMALSSPLPAGYNLIYTSNAVLLTPVPEPAFVLALCGVAGCAGFWRRRRPMASARVC
jgi:fibronectin-binding autotransporter adhesin